MAAGALALGAGAGEGLDKILERALVEAKMKQLADQFSSTHDETVRSHVANEGIDRERIAATERERISRDNMMRANQKDASDARVRDDGRALNESIPGDTRLLNDDPAVPQLRAGGASLRGFSSLPSKSTVAASTLPGDESPEGVTVTSDEKPRPVGVIKGFSAAQTEKGIADKRAADDHADLQKYRTGMLNKPSAPQISIVPTDNGIMRVDRGSGKATPVVGAGGDQLQRPESAQILNRRDMATAVGSHFADAESLINEADQKGLLGPLAGRTFTDFLAGKVGSTGNAENDALLGDLRASLSMVRSGTASLHGRSGANMGIAKDIERRMDEGHMSAAELKGSLQALKKWVDTYATKPGTKTGGSSGAADLIFDPATGTFKKPGD